MNMNEKMNSDLIGPYPGREAKHLARHNQCSGTLLRVLELTHVKVHLRQFKQILGNSVCLSITVSNLGVSVKRENWIRMRWERVISL